MKHTQSFARQSRASIWREGPGHTIPQIASLADAIWGIVWPLRSLCPNRTRTSVVAELASATTEHQTLPSEIALKYISCIPHSISYSSQQRRDGNLGNLAIPFAGSGYGTMKVYFTRQDSTKHGQDT